MRMTRWFFLLSSFLSVFSVSVVQAEIVRYHDPVSGVSFNYPDRWVKVNNQQRDDVVTIMAPNADDFAGCRVRVREDKRFVSYPDGYARSIQKIHYSHEFWDKYLNEYDDYDFIDVNDGAGLGAGFAGVAEATYTSVVGLKSLKHSIVAVSPYYDKVFIVECSSTEESWGKWYPGFMNVLRSVRFRKGIQGHPNGEYRAFVPSRDLNIHGRKTQDLYQQ